MPTVVVTVTLTLPAVPAGVTAVRELALTKVTFVAGAVPKSTVAPRAKLVPVMVTVVPPVAGPDEGLTPVTVGAPKRYVKRAADEGTEVPEVVVTVTETVPAVPAGDTAANDVALLKVTPVAGIEPKYTVAPLAKLLPTICTVVPPVVGPDEGLSAVTVGSTAKVNWSDAEVVDVPAPVVTVTSTSPVPPGETAVIEVALVTVTFVATVAPKSTVAPEAKFVPVIVTVVPPEVEPVEGLRALTLGTE